MKKYTLGIIGTGSLGSIIANTIIKELSNNYEILGVFGGHADKVEALANTLGCQAYTGIDDMIADRPDYIIEAASADVVKELGPDILRRGINLIPLSLGALADETFYNKVSQIAIEHNSRIHIPSGAVGGFDVLKSAVLMEESKVSIRTEKAPQSLNGAPFLQGRELSKDHVEDVFKGSAKEAIRLFPQNVNVAVATALATTGVEDTRVVIRSIPDTKSNTHNIELIGDSIKVNISIETTPSPGNPKSSSLAAYSVIALLNNLVSPITF